MPTIRTVPIFPLDGVFLCPGLLLPLHVFEPRYRAMLARALADDRRIAMCLPAPGHSVATERDPPLHRIAGLGEVVEHRTLPDGRSNILLRGLARIRIFEELPRAAEGYRLVRARPVEEEHPGPGDLSAEVERLAAVLSPGPAPLAAGMSIQELVDTALVALPLPLELKLELFSEPRVEVRVRRLVANLPGPEPRGEFGPADPRWN